MTTTALLTASNYFWIWIAILVIVALVALFKVSPFNAAEPATHGGDDDKPPGDSA
ncbi:MAG TPA: hypothetical protein VGM39_11735 [Kofleriaceae bacterium]